MYYFTYYYGFISGVMSSQKPLQQNKNNLWKACLS